MAVYSPEMQAFRRAFSDLAVAIHEPESLAAELYSKAVISSDVLRGVHETTVPFHKALRLLCAVQDHISINPSVMDVFLSALRGEPAMERLANALLDECRKSVTHMYN